MDEGRKAIPSPASSDMMDFCQTSFLQPRVFKEVCCSKHMVIENLASQLSNAQREVLIAVGKEDGGTLDQIREWTKYAKSSTRKHMQYLRNKGLVLNPVPGLWELSEQGKTLFRYFTENRK